MNENILIKHITSDQIYLTFSRKNFRNALEIPQEELLRIIGNDKKDLVKEGSHFSISNNMAIQLARWRGRKSHQKAMKEKIQLHQAAMREKETYEKIHLQDDSRKNANGHLNRTSP